MAQVSTWLFIEDQSSVWKPFLECVCLAARTQDPLCTVYSSLLAPQGPISEAKNVWLSGVFSSEEWGNLGKPGLGIFIVCFSRFSTSWKKKNNDG